MSQSLSEMLCLITISGIFFSVLCTFRTQAVISLHNFLSFVVLSNVCPFAIPHSLCSAIHLHKLVRLVIMPLHNFLHFVVLNICSVTIPPSPCSAIHLPNLVKSVGRQALSSIPLDFNICCECQIIETLIMYHRNVNSLFLILTLFFSKKKVGQYNQVTML